VCLLVATTSDPKPLLRAARRAGVAERLRLCPLDSEAARRRVHAAADLAVVPRRAPGGLPIKLLDAMARGVACVATPQATGALAIEGVVRVSRDDSAEALGHAVGEVLARQRLRNELANAGRAYVGAEHSRACFLSALDLLTAPGCTPTG